MSAPTAHPSFFEGAPLPVDPDRVQAVLSSLWRSAAGDATGDEPPPFTRVSLGTLVVITRAKEADRIGTIWAEVSERFPSRAILTVVRKGGGRELQAAVSAVCRLSAPGQPHVCSERIRIETGDDGVSRLPGALLPLLEADVPATLWWDLPSAPPHILVDGLARHFDRCLLDLTRATDPAATWQALACHGDRLLTDLAWYRAASWREGVARLFDGVQAAAAAADITSVEVTTAAERTQLFPAALLGGWIAGQLGWQAVERTPSESRWRKLDGTAARVTLTRTPVGDGRPGRLQAALLRAGQDGEWRLERQHDRPRELLIQAHHRDWCRLPARLPATRPNQAEVLLSAITPGADRVLISRALRHAAWMLGWAG